MHYRTLGRTGIQVSPYALGALMFATSMGNAPEESARIIHKALDAGINLIDTADAYGDSEEVVGKALRGRRDDAVALFERLVGLRNDLGLLSEEYDPRYGRQVGNTPQAFSHVPLIQAALNLDRHDGGHCRAGGAETPGAQRHGER